MACLLSAVVITGGCSSMTPPAPSPVPSSVPSYTDTLKPAGARWKTLPARNGVVIASPPPGSVSMPWELSSIALDHRQIDLVAVAGDGDCTTAAGVSVVVSSKSVIVAAISRQEPGRVACASKLVLTKLTVKLPVSVGTNMRLIHAPFDSDWKLPPD